MRSQTKSTKTGPVVCLFILLMALSALAATGTIGEFETSIFKVIYEMPDWLEGFALLVTQFGSWWVALGVVGLLFVVRKNPAPALLVARNGIVVYGVVAVIKMLVSRPRPMILLQDVMSRQVAVFGNGFPSAHTALATVVSLTVMPLLPKQLRWLPALWIGLVAWSRIYLGVHAPLDIVGGFVIGLLVVVLADTMPWPKQLRRQPRKKASKK